MTNSYENENINKSYEGSSPDDFLSDNDHEGASSARSFEARSAEPESSFTGPDKSDASHSASGSDRDSSEYHYNYRQSRPDPQPTVNPESAEPAQQPYYEPWREPVYREARNSGNTYSPSRHSCSGYDYTHYSVPEQPKKKKKKREKTPRAKIGFGRIIAIVLACVILSSAGSGAVSYLVTDYMIKHNTPSTQVVIGGGTSSPSSSTGSDEVPPASSVAVTGDALSRKAIYDLGCMQVVGVKTSVTTSNIFGQTSTAAVTGSGFFISEDGYILTNYHVVEYAHLYGYELEVMTFDGETFPAAIIGYEADNDVAVIKVDITGAPAATFGDSDKMSVGDWVYAIGNPLGELSYTMTGGMVSALDRIIATDERTSINMFQIDAAVNTGNSGGPVYNEKGEVVGIVTAKYSDTGVEGLGFAIPINDAKKIAGDLIANGYVTGKAYLGITSIDVETYVSHYYNIPEGAYVYSVTDGSCAKAAGIQAGDVITKVENHEVNGVDGLKTALRKYNAGDSVKLTIYRTGQYKTVTVVFDEAPPAEAQTGSASGFDGNSPSRGNYPNGSANIPNGYNY